MTSTIALQALDELVTRVSTHTGLSPDTISSQFSEANIPSFKLDDTILVDPKDCTVIIDAWAANIKASLGLAIASTPKVESTPEVEDETLEAVEETVTETTSLSWPDGFADSVNHQYGPSLKKILPTSPDQRSCFLKAIAQDTKAGIALTNELVEVIVRKYNGRGTLTPEKARAGVLKKVNEFLAQG